MSLAPQGPPGMTAPTGKTGAVAVGAPVGDDETGGAEVVSRDPWAGGEGLWCEVASTAMPALAPATTNTLAAARTGAAAQPHLGRRRRGSRFRRERGGRYRAWLYWGWPYWAWCPGPAWLASRNAMSSTVTRRGGSGVTRCSISVSCCSSVFTTSPLRS